jgi:hypothetical protein
MSTLMNVRIPEDLKDDFQDVCKRNHTYMTTEIIRFMKEFVSREIDDELSHQTRLRSLERPTSTEKGLDTWGNLVQNPITKTWMSKDEYYSHVE